MRLDDNDWLWFHLSFKFKFLFVPGWQNTMHNQSCSPVRCHEYVYGISVGHACVPSRSVPESSTSDTAGSASLHTLRRLVHWCIFYILAMVTCMLGWLGRTRVKTPSQVVSTRCRITAGIENKISGFRRFPVRTWHYWRVAHEQPSDMDSASNYLHL